MVNSWTAVSLVNEGKEGISLRISNDEGRGVEYRITLQEASELRENIGGLLDRSKGWEPIQKAPAGTVDRELYLAVEKHLDDMREILFAVIEGAGVTGNRLTMVAPAAAKRKSDVL